MMPAFWGNCRAMVEPGVVAPLGTSALAGATLMAVKKQVNNLLRWHPHTSFCAIFRLRQKVLSTVSAMAGRVSKVRRDVRADHLPPLRMSVPSTGSGRQSQIAPNRAGGAEPAKIGFWKVAGLVAGGASIPLAFELAVQIFRVAPRPW
jgi:hypothetical protein